MHKKLLLLLVILLLNASLVGAVTLHIGDGAITTAIENQMPVDRVNYFAADFGKLYCFTRIIGAEVNTEITHVWYYQENEMARVTLAIGSGDWRTYSSKRFLPQWAGAWEVVVLDAAGDRIGMIPFVLE